MSTNPYLDLQTRLQRLETADPSPPLTVQINALQQWFQQTLLTSDGDREACGNRNREAWGNRNREACGNRNRPQSEQSLLVEIHKQLRLLATDAAFLQTAKTPQTQQQRHQQIRDRLATLNRYCDHLLNPNDNT
jgi:hypothetical protein